MTGNPNTSTNAINAVNATNVVTADTTTTSTDPVAPTDFLSLCGNFWALYGLQITQVALSAVLMFLSSYFQQSLFQMVSNVQIDISNMQILYMSKAQDLYNLSSKYSSGIIEVDNETFLMNMDLPKKIAFTTTDANVTLPNSTTPTTTIPATSITNAISKYKTLFTGTNPLNQLCIVTTVNNVISVKIPDLPNPVSIPSLGTVHTQGDWLIMYQGNPADNYIYLQNSKIQRTYIFRNSYQSISWFMYKDDLNSVYVTMTSGGMTLGDKIFMLVQAPNLPAQISARVKQVDDAMGLVS